MAINNDILFNAAFIGFYCGALSAGRRNLSVTDTDYAGYKDAAVIMATAVDALIAEDATITTGGGDASQLAYADSDGAFNELAKANVLKELCHNAVAGASPAATSAQGTAWAATTQKTKIVAQYTEALLALTNAA